MTENQLKIRYLGYARVSTYGQTLDAQLEQLRKEKCAKIYREKASGAQADRRELLKMLKVVGSGDIVSVTRIDRLARSTFICSLSSSRSWTQAGNSGRWLNRGLIRLPARGG